MASAEREPLEERLREALLLGLGARQSEVDELITEAYQQARTRARELLAEAMTDTLVDLALDSLDIGGDTPTQKTPAQKAPAEPAPASGGQLMPYLYGVVPSGTALAEKLTGVDPDHPVMLIDNGTLAAITSSVSASEFSDASLRENLNDLPWLERVARTHEAVLDAAANEVTVIPMRLCTILRDEDRVYEVLAREEGALQAALDHLRGRREWALKVYLNGAQPGLAAGRCAGTGSKPAPLSGTEYFDRRREERSRQAEQLEELARRCGEIYEHLAAGAADSTPLPLQAPEASGREQKMLLNAAFLIEDGELSEFAAALDELRQHHEDLELELTGPWPAYNFIPGTVGAAW